MRFRRVLDLKVLAFAACVAVTPSAFADTGAIGGTVPLSNTLTGGTFPNSSGLSITPDTAQPITIYSAVLNSNSATGWRLSVSSDNNGKLVRSVVPTGCTTGCESNYTNVTLVKTSGTLGGGLTDPQTTKSLSTGSNSFSTGLGATPNATSATIDYGFDLTVTLPVNRNLLEGTYNDSITVTVASDS